MRWHSGDSTTVSAAESLFLHSKFSSLLFRFLLVVSFLYLLSLSVLFPYSYSFLFFFLALLYDGVKDFLIL